MFIYIATIKKSRFKKTKFFFYKNETLVDNLIFIGKFLKTLSD